MDGVEGCGLVWQVRSGQARSGRVRLGKVRQVGRGVVWPGLAWYGMVWQVWIFKTKNMEEKAYKFREGYSYSVDPEIIGKTLEKIARDNDQEITPHLVVSEAKKSNSPIHGIFDWNNKSAGDKWRIEQARRLLRSISVEIVIREPEEVRAFVSIKTIDKVPVYASIREVISDDDKMRYVIDETKKRLKSEADKLRVYQKLEKMANKIDELILELNY